MTLQFHHKEVASLALRHGHTPFPMWTDWHNVFATLTAQGVIEKASPTHYRLADADAAHRVIQNYEQSQSECRRVYPIRRDPDQPIAETDWAQRSNAVSLEYYGTIPALVPFVIPAVMEHSDLIGVPPAAQDCHSALILRIREIKDLIATVEVIEVEICKGCSAHPNGERLAKRGAIWKLPRLRLHLLDHTLPTVWEPSVRWELQTKEPS